MARNQNGQALLIIILVMVVALTIGLAVVSRTIISSRLATDEKKSQQALSAAEAGIEQEINKQLVGDTYTSALQNFSNGSSYRVIVTSQKGTEFLMQNGQPVPKNVGADIWFVPHKADGTPDFTTGASVSDLIVYWGSKNENNSCKIAALEVIVLYDPANPKTTRSVFDPCDGRRGGNRFDGALANDSSSDVLKNLRYKASVPVPSQALMARVVPLYSDAPIGYSASNLPSQGKKYESIGTASDAKRKVVVYEEWPSLPTEFFQYIHLSTVVQ